MTESVQKQSYPKWQLVLVDASDRKHADVGQFCTALAAGDDRVVHVKLFKNEGIAANTNIGLAESDGMYITLLDHDDVLQPCALFEMSQAVNETGADLLYSDEIVLSGDLKKLGEYHFKPDFGPDTLLGVQFYHPYVRVFPRAAGYFRRGRKQPLQRRPGL